MRNPARKATRTQAGMAAGKATAAAVGTGDRADPPRAPVRRPMKVLLDGPTAVRRAAMMADGAIGAAAMVIVITAIAGTAAPTTAEPTTAGHGTAGHGTGLPAG